MTALRASYKYNRYYTDLADFFGVNEEYQHASHAQSFASKIYGTQEL